jgi:hypothetical protein
MINKRTILIIAALALPVVILALLVHSGTPKNTLPAAAGNANHIPPHPTLEQARANVKNRLAELEKMKPEQWPEEQRKNPHVAPTLQQALTNNRNRLAHLESLTPEQYEAQFKPSAPAPAPPPQAQQQPAQQPAAPAAQPAPTKQ